MPKPIKSHMVKGKRYKIEFLPQSSIGRDTDGFCTNPNEKNRRILLNKNLKDKEFLTLVIHELLHGLFWDIDENAIIDSSECIANLLWRLGYRKQNGNI